MKKLPTLLRDLVAACAIALTAGGAAADITFWQLKNVAFGDGATVNGSFVYDDLANTVTSWNVRVSAGSGLLAFTYVPGDSIVIRAGSPLYTNASYIEFRSQPGGNGVDPRVLRIMPFWDFDVIPVPSSVVSGCAAMSHNVRLEAIFQSHPRRGSAPLQTMPGYRGSEHE